MIGALLGLAGAGVQLAGGLAGADATEETGELNYEVAMQNARIMRNAQMRQIMMERFAQSFERINARRNLKMKRLGAKAQGRNADRLFEYAERSHAVGRENIRRQARDFERFNARQEARAAASGVSFEGSPAAVAIDSIYEQGLRLQDMADQANEARDQGRAQAGQEELGSRFSMMEVEFGKREIKMTKSLQGWSRQLDRLAVKSQYYSDRATAEIERSMMNQQAEAQRLSAMGGFIGGLGSFLSNMQQGAYHGAGGFSTGTPSSTVPRMSFAPTNYSAQY